MGRARVAARLPSALAATTTLSGWACSKAPSQVNFEFFFNSFISGFLFSDRLEKTDIGKPSQITLQLTDGCRSWHVERKRLFLSPMTKQPVLSLIKWVGGKRVPVSEFQVKKRGEPEQEER